MTLMDKPMFAKKEMNNETFYLQDKEVVALN
jgi:hypothetical protein